MLKPAELLEELLRYREAPADDTTTFTWTHKQLCDAVQKQLDTLGDSFLKYHHIAYTVQGPRDQGVDVLLKTAMADELERYVGIQVKSYAELDDRENELVQRLKAGYHDARNHYGHALERYYIALCGDAKAHSKRISALTAEFAKEPKVRIIGPQHLLTFLTMPDATLSAIVDRFLMKDDAIRKQARSEVYGFRDFEVYFILACLTWSFEHGTDRLPSSFFEGSRRIRELEDHFGPSARQRALGKFQATALETVGLDSSRIRTEDFPAIRALYYDIQVRYTETSDNLFIHLYEFLKI